MNDAWPYDINTGLRGGVYIHNTESTRVDCLENSYYITLDFLLCNSKGVRRIDLGTTAEQVWMGVTMRHGDGQGGREMSERDVQVMQNRKDLPICASWNKVFCCCKIRVSM